MFPFYEKQKKLIFVFIGLVIATILVLYYGLHRPSGSSIPQEIEIPGSEISTSTEGIFKETTEEIPEKISIEFDASLFNEPDYKNLKSYGEINVNNEEVGRENPFIPF